MPSDEIVERALLAVTRIFLKIMEDQGRKNMAIAALAYDLDAEVSPSGKVLVEQVANIPDDAVAGLYRSWLSGWEPEDTIGEVAGHG